MSRRIKLYSLSAISIGAAFTLLAPMVASSLVLPGAAQALDAAASSPQAIAPLVPASLSITPAPVPAASTATAPATPSVTTAPGAAPVTAPTPAPAAAPAATPAEKAPAPAKKKPKKRKPKKARKAKKRAVKWNTGKMSWYGPGFYGRRMASGARLKRDSVVLAHRTLPFGTRVELRYRGRTVVAVVKDRGPYVRGRVFDLGPGTAKRLRFNGVHQVKYRVLKKRR